MEPYNKNLPFIRFANDGKTLLDRMVESGIPFTRALKYFRNNPEGPASEFFKLAAEDVIPFYGNYRNGGSVSDYAKEAVLLAAPVPKKRGWVQVDNEATKAFNNKIREMSNGPMPRGAHRDTPMQLRELADMNERGAIMDYVTDLAEDMPWEYNQDFYQALDMIKKQYPNEYRNIILEYYDRFAKQPNTYTNKPLQEHFEPRAILKYGQDPTLMNSYATRFETRPNSPSSIQFTIGELEDALQSKEAQSIKLKEVNNALENLLNNLDNNN